jgi:excisionase family DNA binding protein
VSFGFVAISESIGGKLLGVTAVDLIEDLIELEELAEQEDDAARRQRLVALADRVAHRDAGAKVSEAAEILAISAPTVRAWIKAGLLAPVPDRSPVRIELSSLAAAKRAVDAVRRIKDEPQLLAEVYRILRDRDILNDPNVRQGIEDYRAGRAVELTPELLDELLPPQRRRKSSSKSH